MDIITGTQLYWLTRCDAIKGVLVCHGGLLFFAIAGLLGLWITTFGLASERNDAAEYRKRMDEGRTDYKYKLDNTEFNIATLTAVRKLSWVAMLVCGPLWLSCRLLHPLVPTTKEMAAIVVIPRVANSESVQGLGEGVVDLAKAWMAELKPDKVKAGAAAVAETLRKASEEGGK